MPKTRFQLASGSPHRLFYGALALFPILGACSGTETVVEPPDEPAHLTLEVDARESWAFVDLAAEARVVSVASPSTSADWDIAFFGTSVMVNGGDAGPGETQAYCHCQNAAATDAQVMGFSAEAALAEFEAFTAQNLPTDDSWQCDALRPPIADWVLVHPRTHTVVPIPGGMYMARTAEGTTFGKMQVTAIENAVQQHAGEVTIRYAVQTEIGGSFGDTRTSTLNLAENSPAYFDLLTGSISDESNWDLSLEGFTFRVNGGVSGTGMAGAGRHEGDFDSLLDVNRVPSTVYVGDSFGGAFADPDPRRRWFLYNLQGGHQIWPTFNIYAVRRGSEIYKLQLTSYYNGTGESRFITLRYFPLG